MKHFTLEAALTMSVAVLLLLSLVPQNTGAQPVPPVDHAKEPWGMKRVLERHLAARREMRARDVYKLFYQAAFGVEHLLTDTAGVRAYLLEELSGLDTLTVGEDLLERISMDGEMVRVNLRPFKALNLPPDLLVQAMFRSAAETRPDTLLFYRWWHEYTSLLWSGLIGPIPADLQEWDRRVQEGDLSPVHHSEPYMKAYRPAYRVVRRAVIESILQEQGVQ